MSDHEQTIRKYCAYQDRCHFEVKQRLYQLGVKGLEQDQIIASLIEENFLNEERFAKNYARGHFRMKQWGRNKIIVGLKAKKISAYCIKKGLEEIDEEEYVQTLQKIIEKRMQISGKTKYTRLIHKKLYDYLYQKGYESNLIAEAINKHFKKQ